MKKRISQSRCRVLERTIYGIRPWDRRRREYWRRQFCGCVTIVGFLSLLYGCATPIGVVRGSTQDIQLGLTANVLSAGTLSSWSSQVLHRTNLIERFTEDPEKTLEDLRTILTQPVGEERLRDRLFALSELSFYHAEQSGKSEHYLAAAIYAYAFLFPDDGAQPLDPLDPRGRWAADLYNRGLTRGLLSSDGEEVLLDARSISLPFGALVLTGDPAALTWGGYRFTRFIPVGEFVLRGLSNRYRQAGIGAALAAELAPDQTNPVAEATRKRIPPRTRVPVTAFVRISAPRRAIVEGKIEGKVELFAADQGSTVKLGSREVPLEQETTATLAYQLEGAPVWDFELAGFRFADQSAIFGDGLIMMQPYRHGRIPVVLVHGTASSPVRWAEMFNEVVHDPVLRGRYQFWLFQYNTGQPVLYSAMLLRRALRNVIEEVDPKGEDEALRRMIIIGHSQGGLLTKLMSIGSGNRFWDNVSKEPLDDIEMPAETRELLREGMFFEPVPLLSRVVFIATPHRGSFRASGLVLNLVRRIVTLPGTLVNRFGDLLKGQAFAHLGISQLPTAVDNMSPGNPFIRALNDSPIDPRITAHSIIAVLGTGPITGKTDGVVAYESAHIEGVASEVVVRSGHSTQGHPETIDEVRRILREHIETQAGLVDIPALSIR